MPCVSGRAEMSSARDAVVVRAFRRECGILTLFNGSDGIHLAYAAYFGPFSTFQLALSSLELSSKKKCSNEMLDKIKAILRDT